MMMVSPRAEALVGTSVAGYRDAQQFAPSSAGVSPSSAWIRKRAASVDRVNDDGLRFDQPRLAGQKGLMGEDQRDHVCLCTSDPKIPRPRNAFILYRISHHTKVAQDNPGLSNPDISKIIGDKWKKEPEDEKERWKKLAEEEKRRHQQMYPEYRYKPRRASKGQPPRKGGTSPTEESGRCPKCNGRLLTTPDTFQASTGPITPKNEIGDPMSTQANYAYDSLHVDRRRHSVQAAPPRTYNSREEESPDLKRRRLNDAGESQLMQPPSGTPTSSYTPRQAGDGLAVASGPVHTPSRLPFSGGPLPQPGIPRSQSGPIQAPSRSFSGPQWNSPLSNQRQPPTGQAFQLPPLRTATPPQPSGLGLRPALSRESSFSSEIMTIPAERKLSTLMKLRYQLPNPHGRGQVIAVEGPFDGPGVAQISQVVEEALQSGRNATLRSWAADDRRSVTGSTTESSSGISSPRTPVSIPEYYQSIVDWHEKSRQIVQHVTSGSPELSASSHSNSPVNQPGRAPQLPVALIKNGYSLTETDRFACSYVSPEQWNAGEHWQWAAMHWRGMVAPDLTIYVCPSSTDAIEHGGSVDFQRSINMMLVRVPLTVEVSESTRRRVSFEVREWMADRGHRHNGD